MKYYDKTRALELLGRAEALFKDKVEHSGGMSNTNKINFNDLNSDEAKKMFSEILGQIAGEK